MEREFDAYKLSRCMCHLTITVSEIQRDIGQFFHTPLHSTSPFGVFRWNSATRFGVEKLEWCGYHTVKKISKISLFVLAQLTNVADGQTDRQTDTACRHIQHLCIASRIREFDAYKLSRCMCHLTITVSEIERDIGRKSSFFHTPCIRRLR